MKKNGKIWINPLGGLGDALMLSGVLKAGYDSDPGRRYNLVRRTKYLGILDGHPAIEEVGFPPVRAEIRGTDYWSRPEYRQKGFHAMDILSDMLGVKKVKKKTLYLPVEEKPDETLTEFIPWKKTNILIAPSSDSPRKEMHMVHWEELAARLSSEGHFLIQAGKKNGMHIRKTYSLLGLTSPVEIISLVRKCDLVITSDNFLMHAAHLAGVPAVVLWGPTDERKYGYDGQFHLRSYPVCEQIETCIGPGLNTYGVPCQFGPENHCMNRIPVNRIITAIDEILKIKS